MRHPKLRDSEKLVTREPYPLNEIPDDVVIGIARQLICQLYVGRKDLTGRDWGDIFAEAVGGIHLDSPLGIADVVLGKMAWSMKTVKTESPYTVKNVRLISGRCSPDYSYGITDPHENIQNTGRAVLGIWNERVNLAHDVYNPVRTAVLIRSNDCLSYCLYEEDTNRFRSSDYVWEENRNGNLIGKDIASGLTRFTWQPHGSQFTIHEAVPSNAIKFRIAPPPVLSKKEILEIIGFNPSWVEIIR